MTTLHGSIGAYLRNTFGLWQGNQTLLDACQTNDADGAAAVILLALWQRVGEGEDDLTAARALLAEVGKPEEEWESPTLRKARAKRDAIRREAALPPAIDRVDCRTCAASDICELG